MPIELDVDEQKARALLVRVAERTIQTRTPGLIGYKEFWERTSDEAWGQGRRSQIVRQIDRISAFEIEHNRPPLNELVVKVATREPGENWEKINHYLHTTFRVPLLPYNSHQEAQAACWEHWQGQVGQRATPGEIVEGEPEDRTVTFRKRNAKIIQARKEYDGYICQACDFVLQVDGHYVIDCHHKYPLAHSQSARVTDIAHLVCLCPTCHRVAHTRKPVPLDVEEIRQARGL